MQTKYLNIDSNLDVALTHAALWAKRDIGIDRVDTMTEGIKLLIKGDYLVVAINGDAVDFMPLLKTMRSVTNTPILIVTGSFTTEKEIAALENGADLYARWHERPEDNVASVLAHITRVVERSKMPRPSTDIMVHRDLLIAPASRQVYVKNQPVSLTKLEFNMLRYLIINNGRFLTHTQILRKVWGGDYQENGNDILWRTMSRLRKKLSEASPDTEYIKAARDVGYMFLT